MKKVARAIILDKSGKVLLGRRARGHGQGLFALIGGKPEGDESLTEAVVREVKEEINLKFKPQFFFKQSDRKSDPGTTWEVSYFYGRGTGLVKTKADEISELILVDREDLNKTPIAFGHEKILSEFFAKLAGNAVVSRKIV